MLSRLGAFRVVANRYFCQPVCLGQVKTHRKSRINKKWRKKYGLRWAPCPGIGPWLVGGEMLVGCPCVVAKLKRQLLIDGELFFRKG